LDRDDTDGGIWVVQGASNGRIDPRLPRSQLGQEQKDLGSDNALGMIHELRDNSGGCRRE
jgi:hypothetical protein